MVTPSDEPTFETPIVRMATGGGGVGHHPDGRVAFVDGATTGDVVMAEIRRAKKRHVEADTLSVISGGPGRVVPPCTHVAQGCGGCDWQHIAPHVQSEHRRAIVGDVLQRIGRLDSVDVRPGPPLDPFGYRTTVRMAVAGDRLAFRARRRHETIVPDACLTAHPLADEIIANGRFRGRGEVVVRVGVRTGERMVVMDDGVSATSLPDGVRSGADDAIHEVIAGRRLRVSGSSFFQCRPDGADVLVAAVEAALDGAPDGAMLDAYGGVGLFGATVGAGRPVTLVETSSSSVADARINLAAVDATIVHSAMEQWEPGPMAAVVADPARAGLGSEVASRLGATGATHVALVSCDPGALGRDARLLVDLGYTLDWVQVIDMFGSTSHIETVSRFTRG